MDPMMMAIIGVVVLVFIAGAFFFMKSRGGNTDVTPTSAPTPSANRPKTLAEQQREMEQQRLHNPAMTTPPSAPAVDPLSTAQQFIQRQDFGQAVATLKTAIQQNPQRSALYLPLLNIFAQQKNIAEFNQYLNPLLSLNDPNASTQAMSLKKLLDDEMAFQAQPVAQPAPVQAQAVPVAVASTQPESLDFDGFNFNDTATTPAVQPVMASTPAPQVDNDLSFDEIDFSSVSTSPATPVATTASPSVTQTTADELDFSFDEPVVAPTVTTTTPATPVVKAEPTAELDDFSFDFDTPATPAVTSTPTAQVAPTANDSLSLDDEFSFDEPAVAPTVAVAPVATPAVEEIDEFDFGMDDFAVEQPAPQAVVAPVATPAVQAPEVVEDFDFDFEETPIASTQTAPTVTAPVATTVEDEFAMDDFSFDIDDVKAEPNIAPAVTASAPLMADSEDMVFGLTEESRPETVHTATPVATSVVETPTTETVETFGDDFDLSFDMPETPVATQTVTAPVVEIPAVTPVEEEALFDLDFDTPTTTPAVATESVKTEPLLELPTATDEYDTFNQLDDLSAVSAPVVQTPVVETPQAVVAPVVASVTPAVVAEVAPAPVATAPVAMGGDLMSIVNGLDTAQLNIDLASQYVQLGEYDSAKRLLAEVTQANPQQQQQIAGLMDKIA